MDGDMIIEDLTGRSSATTLQAYSAAKDIRLLRGSNDEECRFVQKHAHRLVLCLKVVRSSLLTTLLLPARLHFGPDRIAIIAKMNGQLSAGTSMAVDISNYSC